MVSFCLLVYNAFVPLLLRKAEALLLLHRPSLHSIAAPAYDSYFSSFAFIAYQRGFLNFAVQRGTSSFQGTS